MISIETVVWFVIYALGACGVFALLFFAVDYTCKKFPSMEPAARFIKVGLVLLGVLLLISIIMALIGHPLITFDNHQMRQL